MLIVDLEVRRDDFNLRADFAADDDEIVAVVGPNGAGKTTLLRAIAGLQSLSAGSIASGAVVWEDAERGINRPPEDRSVGYVPQAGLLFAHMSVIENVAFATAGDITAARVWLERLGLEDLADIRPAQLSGGQAQLVALARALARDPEVLLLDEPMASVDAANRAGVRRQLRTQLRQTAAVRLMVTHDALEAAAIADRILVVDGGAITQRGTIEELVTHPRSPYVAELVGVNFYTGVATDGLVVVDGGGILHSGEAVNGEVIAAVHPRAVALHLDHPTGTPRNVWRGRVSAIEPSLDRIRVTVEGDLRVVAEVTRAGSEMVAEGDAVWVSIKASEVSAFPR